MKQKAVVLSLFLLVAAALLVVGYPAAQASEPELVGTWKVVIPGVEGGAPGFEALQTFHADGTFTETSNLLGQKQEGPAHGVWSQEGDAYHVTFQLFAFDAETGQSTGMFRVRLKITMDGADRWTAQTGSVHFIAPDGTMELLDDGSASPPIEATRITVEPVE